MKRMGKIRCFLEGLTVSAPKTIDIDPIYDDVGDAYFVLKFAEGRKTYCFIIHSEDMKGFLNLLHDEVDKVH